MMRRACFGTIAAGLLLAAAASAAPPSSASAADLPPKTISLVVYGDDPCPKSTSGEIVVCARKPDNERYRIPKELRAKQKEEHGGKSWSSQVASATDALRATRPNSCSPVGSGGETGCMQQMFRSWSADRRAMRDHTDGYGQ
jgi:hypothetical protein